MDAVALKPITTIAIQRLIADMSVSAPLMAARAEAWMAGLTKTGQAADYFQHPLAFPMLLLPCWVEESLWGQIDIEFQTNLVYSSVSGYYFIRMIDNVMDEQSQLERKLLPMTGFFHAQATATYHRYFDHRHHFWAYFSRWNTQSADFAIEDGSGGEIDIERFRQIAGKKVVAGKIPIAAVLARYEQLERLPAWEHFYDKLSCWHQMFNDVLSWHKDIQHATASYFLCEGQQRKYPDETMFAWLLREGFAWGLETLDQWLDELLTLANSLGSQHLKQYLVYRDQLLESQKIDLQNSVAAMWQLSRISENTVLEGDKS